MEGNFPEVLALFPQKALAHENASFLTKIPGSLLKKPGLNPEGPFRERNPGKSC